MAKMLLTPQLSSSPSLSSRPTTPCYCGSDGHSFPVGGGGLASLGATVSTNSGRGKRLQYSKTEVCPWLEKGRCLMGEACNYAHSKTELRYKPDLSCTKLCPQAEKGRRCTNPHCRFAHDFNQLRATSAFYKTKMCKFWAKGNCPSGNQCRHAHGREELRKPLTQAGEERSSMSTNGASMPTDSVVDHRKSSSTASSDFRSGGDSRFNSGGRGSPESNPVDDETLHEHGGMFESCQSGTKHLPADQFLREGGHIQQRTTHSESDRLGHRTNITRGLKDDRNISRPVLQRRQTVKEGEHQNLQNHLFSKSNRTVSCGRDLRPPHTIANCDFGRSITGEAEGDSKWVDLRRPAHWLTKGHANVRDQVGRDASYLPQYMRNRRSIMGRTDASFTPPALSENDYSSMHDADVSKNFYGRHRPYRKLDGMPNPHYWEGNCMGGRGMLYTPMSAPISPCFSPMMHTPPLPQPHSTWHSPILSDMDILEEPHDCGIWQCLPERHEDNGEWPNFEQVGGNASLAKNSSSQSHGEAGPTATEESTIEFCLRQLSALFLEKERETSSTDIQRQVANVATAQENANDSCKQFWNSNRTPTPEKDSSSFVSIGCISDHNTSELSGRDAEGTSVQIDDATSQRTTAEWSQNTNENGNYKLRNLSYAISSASNSTNASALSALKQQLPSVFCSHVSSEANKSITSWTDDTKSFEDLPPSPGNIPIDCFLDLVKQPPPLEDCNPISSPFLESRPYFIEGLNAQMLGGGVDDVVPSPPQGNPFEPNTALAGRNPFCFEIHPTTEEFVPSGETEDEIAAENVMRLAEQLLNVNLGLAQPSPTDPSLLEYFEGFTGVAAQRHTTIQEDEKLRNPSPHSLYTVPANVTPSTTAVSPSPMSSYQDNQICKFSTFQSGYDCYKLT